MIILEPPPGPYYLDTIRFGQVDGLASDLPILSDAQPLTITYKFGGGIVRGGVEDCGGSRVLLLPADAALRRVEFVRETVCDARGRFEFAAIRPGEYYGVALSADSSTEWYASLSDGALLKRRATRVTVRTNESTEVQIRLTRW